MWIALLLAAAALVWLAWTWNRLVAMRAALAAAWASVDVLLKRRTDLVPQLVAVVQGAMDYERQTLTGVTEARAKALTAGGVEARAAAESALGSSVRQLVALVEKYPDLRANANALKFQEQLSETENDLAMARRYYNAVCRDYNTLRETFPTMLVANALRFPPGAYFELAEASEANVPSARLDRGV